MDKITERNWKDKTKFSVAYRKDLQDYTQYAINRRKWAHESENTFARLTPQILGNAKKTLNSPKLLLWVYGKDTSSGGDG